MKESLLDIPPCSSCGCRRRIDETVAMTAIVVSCGCRFCNNVQRERFSFRLLGRHDQRPVTDAFGNIIVGARSDDV